MILMKTPLAVVVFISVNYNNHWSIQQQQHVIAMPQPTTTLSAATTNHQQQQLLDLSFTPMEMKATQRRSNRIQQFIKKNHVWSNTNTNNNSVTTTTTVVIDMSHSNLGDDTAIGLDFLRNASVLLFNNTTPTTSSHTTSSSPSSSPSLGINLVLHSNRLTVPQVTRFLNDICDNHYTTSSWIHNNNNHSDTTTINTTMPTPQLTTPTTIRQRPPIFWNSLDFGWNLLSGRSTAYSSSKRDIQRFHSALQKILSQCSCNSSSLEQLHLSCCGIGPATCRALAKGLLRRFATTTITIDSSTSETTMHRSSPISLYLSNNPRIGDSGMAAIAAAIRTVTVPQQIQKQKQQQQQQRCHTPLLLDTLDLSKCDIGDIGIEALVLALEDAVAPVMIRRILLCHNRITDQGALALGRVLLQRNVDGDEIHIDLSNNPAITDRGITTLLSAVEKGGISNLIVRSCSIQADGAELVGRTLQSIALKSYTNKGKCIEIDLSGNPIGILRGKSEKKNVYSAGAMKSKASATVSAYASQGFNFLKKGLGSVGVSLGPENDDDDGEQVSDAIEESDKSNSMRCGFKSLANAFLSYDQDVPHNTEDTEFPTGATTVTLGLRRTFCDTAGADALAAMIMATRDTYKGMTLKLELDLNPVVEEDMVHALYGHDDNVLVEMAERHNDAMDVLRQAQERAVATARVLAARRKQAVTSASQYDDTQYDNDDTDYNMDDDELDDDQEFDEEYDDLLDTDDDREAY